MQPKRVGIIALITGALLLVPFFFMQFGIQLYDPGSGYETLQWSAFDFIAMGIMLFSTGILLDWVWRTAGTYRFIAAAFVFLLFVWLWVELAVGLFTNWGS